MCLLTRRSVILLGGLTLSSVPKDLQKGLISLIILVSGKFGSIVVRGSAAKHPGTSSDRGQWVHPLVHGRGH